MREIYTVLAAMSLAELEEIAGQLKYEPDPWAVGARKMIAWEIRSTKHSAAIRNKIVSF